MAPVRDFCSTRGDEQEQTLIDSWLINDVIPMLTYRL